MLTASVTGTISQQDGKDPEVRTLPSTNCRIHAGMISARQKGQAFVIWPNIVSWGSLSVALPKQHWKYVLLFTSELNPAKRAVIACGNFSAAKLRIAGFQLLDFNTISSCHHHASLIEKLKQTIFFPRLKYYLTNPLFTIPIRLYKQNLRITINLSL